MQNGPRDEKRQNPIKTGSRLKVSYFVATAVERRLLYGISVGTSLIFLEMLSFRSTAVSAD